MLFKTLRYGILASVCIVLSEILKNLWFYSGTYPELFIVITSLIFMLCGFLLKSQWNHLNGNEVLKNSSSGNSGLMLLSKREQEVLEYLLSNLPNKEIADKLNIGTSTLKTHINAIYRKLNITCRRELHEKMQMGEFKIIR